MSLTNFGSSSDPHFKGLSSKFFQASGYLISIILSEVFSTAFKFYYTTYSPNLPYLFLISFLNNSMASYSGIIPDNL